MGHIAEATSHALAHRENQVSAYELLAPLWAIQNLTEIRNCRFDL